MHLSPSLQPVTSSSLSPADHIDTSANLSNAPSFALDDGLISAAGLETYSGATQLSATTGMLTAQRPFHERYYFEDGTVQVEIEGVLYNIHRHFLEKDSSFFELNDKDSRTIALPGIVGADFDAFLSIFYPKEYGSFEATTINEWSAILNLADKWGFKRIRALAIAQITHIASPVDIVVLGRRYSIDGDGWHPADAYRAICLRPDALTLEEGNLLGMEDVIKITSIRQKYGLGSRSPGSPPPTLEQISSHFGLPDGGHKYTQASSSVCIRAPELFAAATSQAAAASEKKAINPTALGQTSNSSTLLHEIPLSPLDNPTQPWIPRIVNRKAFFPMMVYRKVMALLNKLTMEKFDSISDQIITWANKSETEKDGRTLIQVIRLVFEKAKDEAEWSEMYARLCRKMMEKISASVQDDGIRNSEGKPIAGGQLFRKYLLNRCQDDFERGWAAKDAAAKTGEDDANKAANDKNKNAPGDDEARLYSDEHYAASKAKRQGLGLIKFMGELFKLQMLTERIMHECVKKLLRNVENPEEEEIASLCMLLQTVGALLDTPKARAHVDVYFSHMKELARSDNVTPCMQIMLRDVVELRDRKWNTCNVGAAPTTLAAVHDLANRDRAATERESVERMNSVERTGSRRGGERGQYDQQSPDGFIVSGDTLGTLRLLPKAGHLSNFGKINKAAPLTFGPTSVFPKDTKANTKQHLDQDSKEFFSVRDLDEAEDYFQKLAPKHRFRLVDKLVNTAIEAKFADAQLVGDFFARAHSKKLCSEPSFEKGFLPIAELLDDIAIDAPKAFELMAIMVKGASLSENARGRIAAKSVDCDKLLTLMST